MNEFEWSGFGQTMRMLGNLAEPDPTPALEGLEDVIETDNQRGNLAGLDKDGVPYERVTYRPELDRPKKVTPRQRNRVRAGARGIFAGLGPHSAGTNNNLTPQEYRRLGGPPLCPRGPYSRLITNLFTEHGPISANEWEAVGAWRDVVSVEGEPFLEAHFTGANVGRGHKVKLPVRDARGVRPEGREEAVAVVDRWGRSLLTG